MKIIERLRRVDNRIAAKVSRDRIGSLNGRVYWQAANSKARVEAPVFSFADQGVSGSSFAGQSAEGHFYVARIDGTFWESIRHLKGDWFVSPTGLARDIVAVEPLNQNFDGSMTYAELSFRVKETVTHQTINLYD
jgi:hypothetical protein